MKDPTSPVGAGVPACIALEGIDGAGKTSLADRLPAVLAPKQVLSSRLSPASGALFRRLVNADETDTRYQDVIPPGLRRATYAVDACAQFFHLRDLYARQDALIFDRWLQTYDVYCGPADRHAGWFTAIESTLPRPELLCYVRVTPETAMRRLVARGDWTARRWSGERLLTELRELAARYDELLTGPDAPDGVVVVDAERPADDVAATVADLVRSRLPAGSPC